MSREEAMKAFIESGMELRRDDIELGKKLERERIIKLLESRLVMAKDEAYGLTAMRVSVDRQSAIAVTEALIYAIKGEQK